MTELKQELKQELITQLNLQFTVSQIQDDTPLFGEGGLGLDSIDALEIVVILNKKYGVKLEKPEDGKEILTTIQSLADYINSQQNK